MNRKYFVYGVGSAMILLMMISLSVSKCQIVSTQHDSQETLTSESRQQLFDSWVKGAKPIHRGHASWIGLPGNLDKAVKKSPIICIGRPVDLVRIDFMDLASESLSQYTVYLIQVEQYLKDETQRHSPTIKFWEWGGLLGGGWEMNLATILRYNQQHIFFLEPVGPKGTHAYWHRKWIQIRRQDECHTLFPALQIPIKDGKTQPRDPNTHLLSYQFADGSSMVDKPIGSVTDMITAAIRSAEGKKK